MPNSRRRPSTPKPAAKHLLSPAGPKHSPNQDQERNKKAGIQRLESYPQNPGWYDILKDRSRVPQAPQRVAWYPSCGAGDFHPLLYFKSQFLNVAGIPTNEPYFAPDLWVFSDPWLESPYKKWDFQPNESLYQDERTSITLQHAESLRPGPPRTKLAPGVTLCEHAWLCTVAIQSKTLGNHTTRVLFFAGDNIDLLTRLFIGEGRLPLTHLYWICDGWTSGMGMGGDRGDGNFLFLKPLALSLGIKWAISEYIENDCGKPVVWPPELRNHQHHALGNREFRKIGTTPRTESDQDGVPFYEAQSIS